MRNLGMGENPVHTVDSTRGITRANVSIYHSSDYPSRLLLPVVTSSIQSMGSVSLQNGQSGSFAKIRREASEKLFDIVSPLVEQQYDPFGSISV